MQSSLPGLFCNLLPELHERITGWQHGLQIQLPCFDDNGRWHVLQLLKGHSEEERVLTATLTEAHAHVGEGTETTKHKHSGGTVRGLRRGGGGSKSRSAFFGSFFHGGWKNTKPQIKKKSRNSGTAPGLSCSCAFFVLAFFAPAHEDAPPITSTTCPTCSRTFAPLGRRGFQFQKKIVSLRGWRRRAGLEHMHVGNLTSSPCP